MESFEVRRAIMAKRRYLDGNYDSLQAAVLDWQRMAPIASQLHRPVGGSLADGFTGLCRACGQEIGDGDLRGRVEQVSAMELSIFALGVCSHCRCITPFEFLIRERDGELVVQPIPGSREQNGDAYADMEPGMQSLMESLQRFRLIG